MTAPIELAAERQRRSAPMAAPKVPVGREIAAPPLRTWDVDGVLGLRMDRGNSPATAHVRLAIEMDSAIGRWRVAIARGEESETLVLQSDHDGGSIRAFLNDLLSWSFPVMDGAGTLLPFSQKDGR